MPKVGATVILSKGPVYIKRNGVLFFFVYEKNNLSYYIIKQFHFFLILFLHNNKYIFFGLKVEVKGRGVCVMMRFFERHHAHTGRLGIYYVAARSRPPRVLLMCASLYHMYIARAWVDTVSRPCLENKERKIPRPPLLRLYILYDSLLL